MKKLTTLSLCISLMFFLACQTEPVDIDNQQSILSDNEQNNSHEGDEEDDDDDSQSDEETCETLFAIGDDNISTCFLDDGFNRWGWTIGPLTSGEYTFDLYSGAGQCDIDKGTYVGSLSVNYNEELETVDVNYEMVEGYVLNETHLYVGNQPYPLGQNGNATVAPGQFPEQNQLDNASSDSYSLSGFTGEIYVIAHGVVCSDDNDDSDNDDGDDDGDDNGGAF